MNTFTIIHYIFDAIILLCFLAYAGTKVALLIVKSGIEEPAPDTQRSPRAIPEHYTELFWIAPDAFESSRKDADLALIDTPKLGVILAIWHAPCNPQCAGYWVSLSSEDEEYSSEELKRVAKRVAILGREEDL